MSKNFEELRKGMSAKAREEAKKEADRLLKELKEGTMTVILINQEGVEVQHNYESIEKEDALFEFLETLIELQETLYGGTWNAVVVSNPLGL